MPKKRKFFAGAPPKKGKQMVSENKIIAQDLTFIRLVKDRNYTQALEIIDQVQDINVVDQQTQNTVLHFAALRLSSGFIERLEQRTDLNYLVQNKEGRYPSELAWEVSGDEELGAKLIQKEKEQADREDIQAWPKAEPPEL